MKNRVTVFSNGLADFVRSYSAKKGEKTEIAIPAKTGHVGDILASLNLYGNVELASPPVFRPANENDGDLELSPENVIEQLATKLSGSKVAVYGHNQSTLYGKLVGLHVEENATGGDAVNVQSLVVLTESGFEKIPFSLVKNIVFQDESVKSEIEKALQRNFQKVKPNSTFINLSVVGKEDNAEAVIQYTVPNAAWKISYRLNEVNGKTEFKGLAIVDNNTEEDWRDVYVSVVTGEPITFETDLADSKTPRRNRVNVVKETALGAVEVDYGYNAGGASTRSASIQSLQSRGMKTASMQTAMMCSASPEGDFAGAVTESFGGAPSSMGASAESKEVGDFSVFTSKNPVTIEANRSAVIPVFDANINAETVLHYKNSNHPERPYRSLQFKNETKHSLGRGVLTLYKDGIYSGSAVLPATKQNEEQLIPFALETGVRVKQNSSANTSQLSNISFNKGVCVTKSVVKREVEYTIINSKDEELELFIDVDNQWSGSNFSAVYEDKTIGFILYKNGHRFCVKTKAKSTTTLKVVESLVQSSQVTFNINNFHSVDNYIGQNSDILRNEKFNEVVKAFEDFSKIQDDISLSEQEVEKLTTRQNRTRENLKAVAGKSSEGQEQKWLADLSEIEKKITVIEDTTIPDLQTKEKNSKQKFEKKLKDLVVEWSK